MIELLALPGAARGASRATTSRRLLTGVELRPTDVLVIAHKVVSKAEGRMVRLADVTPGERATALAAEHGKDPRHVEVILSEATELVRADAGRLICRTRHGFVCANAGVDASNAAEPDSLILLPVDPDASARALRARLPSRPAVRHHRLVRPRLAAGPVRGRDRDRRAGAAAGLARASRTRPGASCTRR